MLTDGLDKDLTIKQEVDVFEECCDFGTSYDEEDHFHIKQEPVEIIQPEEKENHNEDELVRKMYAEIQSSKFPIVLLRKIDEPYQDTSVGKNFFTKIKLESLFIKQEPKDQKISQFEDSSLGTESTTECSYKCPECSYTAKRKTNLVTHLLVHYGTKRFVCTECEFKSNYKRSLKFHMLSHYKTKILKCWKCDYTTNFSHNLKRHALTHLTEKFANMPSNAVKNLGVEKVGLSKKLMAATFGENFGNIDEEKPTFLKTKNVLYCSKCNYSSKRKSNLKLHLRQHSGLKMYKCTECDYETNWYTCFKRHTFSHSGVLLYKCHICNYGSNRKCYLERHLLTHCDKKLHKCTKCNYATNWIGNLRSHLVRHTTSKTVGKRCLAWEKCSSGS